jgi:hypothetical protein
MTACLERPPSGEVEAPLCVVKRTEVMNNIEQRLRFAMVAYIGGNRPAVSCAQVVEALVSGRCPGRGSFGS